MAYQFDRRNYEKWVLAMALIGGLLIQTGIAPPEDCEGTGVRSIGIGGDAILSGAGNTLSW